MAFSAPFSSPLEEPMKVPVSSTAESEVFSQRNEDLRETIARLEYENALMRESTEFVMQNAWMTASMQYYQSPMAMQMAPWHYQTGMPYSDATQAMGATTSTTPTKKSKVWQFLKRGEGVGNKTSPRGESPRSTSDSSSVSTSVGDKSMKSCSSLGSSSVVAPPPGLEGSADATTMMMKNIPNQYTREMLFELFKTHGFGEVIDLIYLPMDFQTQNALGYCFVNLTSAKEGTRFCECFSGYSNWSMPSDKVCWVSPSEAQGISAHVERYRNSPVMHESVPDIFRPALYSNGERVAFPPPTKNIRAPRLWSRRNA